MRALSSFLGLPSRQCCALAVALHRRDSGLAISHARVFMKYLNAKIYGIWPQTDIHTHNFRKCSHASVGLAQARPNHTVTISHTKIACKVMYRTVKTGGTGLDVSMSYPQFKTVHWLTYHSRDCIARRACVCMLTYGYILTSL